MNTIIFYSWKNCSGYQWNSEEVLEPIETITERGKDIVSQLQKLPEEIYQDFLKILMPVYDSGISDKKWLYLHDKDHKDFNEDIYNEIKRNILKFANTYGFSNMFDSVSYLPSEETTDIFVEQDWKAPSVVNVIEEAWELWGYVKNGIRYKSEIAVRLNQYHPLKIEVDNKQRGTRFITEDILGSIWWSWFFSEIKHKVKECKWCKAPIFHRVDAKFCKPPERQCKNKFNNAQIKARKEKSKNADK